MPTIYDNSMFQLQPQGTPTAPTTPTNPTPPPSTFTPIAPTNDNIFGPGGAFGTGYTGPATTTAHPVVTQPTSTNTFGAGGAFGVVDPATGLTRQYNSQGQAYGQLPSSGVNTFSGTIGGNAFGAPLSQAGGATHAGTGIADPNSNTGLNSDQILKRSAVNKALMGQSYFNPSTGMFNW